MALRLSSGVGENAEHRCWGCCGGCCCCCCCCCCGCSTSASAGEGCRPATVMRDGVGVACLQCCSTRPSRFADGGDIIRPWGTWRDAGGEGHIDDGSGLTARCIGPGDITRGVLVHGETGNDFLTRRGAPPSACSDPKALEEDGGGPAVAGWGHRGSVGWSCGSETCLSKVPGLGQDLSFANSVYTGLSSAASVLMTGSVFCFSSFSGTHSRFGVAKRACVC
mmetsp:Transcript_96624/g.191543  ORF Transcript_96624/g.191543 Transcript_96624/m.191543 type:complete len:222 (-) Transcript_96624:1031-1696(-)